MKTTVKVTQGSHLNIDIVCTSFERGVTEAIKLYNKMGLIGRIYIEGANGKMTSYSN